MGKGRWLAAGIMLGTLGGVLGCIYAKRIYYHFVEQQLRATTEEHLPQIMAVEEGRFGLQFKSKPRIEFLPSIRLADQEGNLSPCAGVYQNEVITLSLDAAALPNESLKGIITDSTMSVPIDSTMEHELIHHYTAQLRDDLKIRFPGKDDPAYLGTALVEEGMAQYAQKMLDEDTMDKFDDHLWPADLERFRKYETFYFYTGGYHLVKPILDRHGARGIEELVKDPPTQDDLLALPEYQQRILKKLE